MHLKNKSIAFIGGGHITEIIIENLTSTTVIEPQNLLVSDPDEKRLEYLAHTFSVETTSDNRHAVDRGDIVFICVLPQIVTEVISELSDTVFSNGKVLVTLAAGIPMAIYSELGEGVPIIRALPNPPSQIGQGIAALALNEYVTKSQQQDILTLFESLGEVVILKEEQINTAMALSSPASIYLFFDSMTDAGVLMGIDRTKSRRIAYQTIVGAMEVWKQRNVSPDELMNEACTPGGISVESLFTLNKYAFRAAISEAIRNAVRKAGELGNTS